MCTSWSGCSPAAWWWWSACPCRGEWTSITSRRGQRFATTATPTTSCLSGSTDRCGHCLSVKVFSLHTAIYCSFSVPAKRLVVCLEESVYIHNIKDMKLLKTLLNTPTNPSGRIEMTSVFGMSELFSLLERRLFFPELDSVLTTRSRLRLNLPFLMCCRSLCALREPQQFLPGVPWQCHHWRNHALRRQQPGEDTMCRLHGNRRRIPAGVNLLQNHLGQAGVARCYWRCVFFPT